MNSIPLQIDQIGHTNEFLHPTREYILMGCTVAFATDEDLAAEVAFVPLHLRGLPDLEPEGANVDDLPDLFSADDLHVTPEALAAYYAGQFNQPEDRLPDFPRLNLIDLSRTVAAPPALLTPCIIVGQHHSMFGVPGGGKTWVALLDAARVLGRGQVVVWVDKEMGRAAVKERLLLLGVQEDMLTADRFVYCEMPVLDGSKESREQWGEMLRLLRPALVVVDALTEVIGDFGGSDNRAEDVQKWLGWYLEPARRSGASTLILDHTGHEDVTRERGSIHKAAAAKLRWAVSGSGYGRNPGEVGSIVVKCSKNTLAAEVENEYRFRIGTEADGSFVFEPTLFSDSDGRDTGAQERVEREVEQVLIEAAPQRFTPTALRDAVKARPNSIRDACIALAAKAESPVEREPGSRSSTWVYFVSERSPSLRSGSVEDTLPNGTERKGRRSRNARERNGTQEPKAAESRNKKMPDDFASP
jgi:hypothetical protein